MTERAPTIIHVTPRPDIPRRVEDEKQALRELADAPYLAFCLVKGMQQFIALAVKRWPELR